jgi:hypothetical protein
VPKLREGLQAQASSDGAQAAAQRGEAISGGKMIIKNI